MRMTQQQVDEFNLHRFGLELPLAKEESAPLHVPDHSEEHSSITGESDQHEQLVKWAKFNGIVYRHSPMGRPHFEGNGELDFWLAKNGGVCAVEMKFGKRKPTHEQLARMT